MRPPDYDVAILGGGLAGLSLAVRLIGLPNCRVLVVEPRTEYRRDRTWSYWSLVDHPFASAVAHEWSTWEVARFAEGGERLAVARGSRTLPYRMIPSDRFYEAARAAIAASANVTLRLGSTVTGVHEDTDGVLIETTGGAVRAGLVFDSRPPPADVRSLVQRFLGQEVVTDRPVFDPGRITLMDFAVRQQPGVVRFLYMLPTSQTEALVEDTWLAPGDLALPDHRDAIRTYLAERYGAAIEAVTFEETGAIPMSPGLQAPRRAGRVIPIGTAGGAIKPSSGYGFLGIQRMAAAHASDLAAGRRPMPFQTRSRTAQWMDAVFLVALQRYPETAPNLFVSMFEGCEPDALIRFLNDVGSPVDTLKTIASMPKAVMLAAAARSMTSA